MEVSLFTIPIAFLVSQSQSWVQSKIFQNIYKPIPRHTSGLTIQLLSSVSSLLSLILVVEICVRVSLMPGQKTNAHLEKK